ncbi:MAG: GNAT family N-acetyltransferase [Bacillota bacterium]
MIDMSNVKVRTIERKDLQSIRDLIEIINRYDKMEISFPDQMFEYLLSQPKQKENIFLAYMAEKLIGFAMCGIFGSLEKVKFELHIHPDYRKKRLGSRLFDILMDAAHKNNAKAVEIGCKQQAGDSVRFVESRGFQPFEYSWKMDMELNGWEHRAMPEELHIRRVMKEDVELYVDIMTNAFKGEGEQPFKNDIHERLFLQPNTHAFFLEKGDAVMATAAVNLEVEINRGYIYNVGVYNNYRGMGYGKLILTHCANYIKENRFSKASLIVKSENHNALKLYKSIGFKEIETFVGYKLRINNK